VSLPHPEVFKNIMPGHRIMVDDGKLQLEAERCDTDEIEARVLVGGTLSDRKGVNLPHTELSISPLTEKDRADLAFGLDLGVDWVALSFVQRPADVIVAQGLIDGRAGIMAKIEKPAAFGRIDDIIALVDAVMVARGDLGVEVSPEKVPMLQKQIIERCNRKGLPVITATQMLESMIHEPRPTRAEASDVANAIIDGTDAVMLSGESAIGAYPVRAVQMMARIASEVEAKVESKSYPATDPTDPHALSEAATHIGRLVHLRGIVVLTTSGYTARLVAAERSKTPLFALTTDAEVYHSLNLFWGIKPLLVEGVPDNFEGLVAHAEATLRARNSVRAGDKILVLGGVPAGHPRGSNFLKIHTV
jgi:pyruvate kinase